MILLTCKNFLLRSLVCLVAVGVMGKCSLNPMEGTTSPAPASSTNPQDQTTQTPLDYVSNSENDEPADLKIQSDRSVITVNGAGGVSRAYISVSVLTKLGVPVSAARNVKVRLSIIRGPGGGEYIADTVMATGDNGIVVTTLNAGTRSGNIVVGARITEPDKYRSIKTEQSLLTIAGGPPDENHFQIVTEKLNIWAWDVAGNTSKITAYVGDRYGNPVPQGYVVNFWTTGGLIQGSAVTDAKGSATVELIGQGGTKRDAKNAPDSTDFAPLRDDLDLRAYYSGESVGKNRSVRQYILFNDIVEVDSSANWRKESVKTGDGQTIVFASISNDSAVYSNSSSELLWDHIRVVFSGKPYAPYKTTINGIEQTSAVITHSSAITLSCFLTDVNGNQLVGGTQVAVEVSADGFNTVQNFSKIPDGQQGLERFVCTLEDESPESRKREPAKLVSNISGKDIKKIAPSPARIIADIDNARFSFDGSSDSLVIKVNGTEHVIAFNASDSTRQQIANKIDAIPQLRAEQFGFIDTVGGLRLYTEDTTSSASIQIMSNSSVAGELGMAKFSAIQFGNSATDITFSINGTDTSTVRFSQKDTTLGAVAYAIELQASELRAKVQGGEIEVFTDAVGDTASLSIDPKSSANNILSFERVTTYGLTKTASVKLKVTHPGKEIEIYWAHLTFM
ncbi:MAG: hypothetical protein GF398_21955 [Chitinivibrionales bacterium]|nr:hypothetical protein [Chitinivibrionales bacterium]